MANKRVRTTPRYLSFVATAGGQNYTVTGDGVVVDETLVAGIVAVGNSIGVATVVTDSAAPVTPPDSPFTDEQYAGLVGEFVRLEDGLLIGPSGSVIPVGDTVAAGQTILTRTDLAKTGQVGMLVIGNSIPDASISWIRQYAEQLQMLYGAAAVEVINFGLLGGSNNTASNNGAHNGSSKQPFGGPFGTRLRMVPTSTPLTFYRYCDRLTFLHSKESDAIQQTVVVDDGAPQTIGPAAGAQAYGVETTINLTLGYHKIVVMPPATGFAYPERLIVRDSTVPGIWFDFCTIGGWAMRNLTILTSPQANQVAGIAIEGNNGIDAMFGSGIYQAVIGGGQLVNDANRGLAHVQTLYRTTLQRAGEQSLADGVQVLDVVEPGGHYDETTDPQHDAYLDGRAYHLAAMSKFPNWQVVDWRSLIYETDTAAMRAKWYSVDDFTHPQLPGHRVALAAVCAATGVLTPSESSAAKIRDARRFNVWPSQVFGFDKTTVVGGVTKTYAVPAGLARDAVSQGTSSDFQGRKRPYYRDTTAENRAAALVTEIAAGVAVTNGVPTTVRGRKAMTYNLKSMGLGTFVDFPGGVRVRYTVEASGTFSLRLDTPARFYVDGAPMALEGNAGTRSTMTYTPGDDTPYVVSFEVGATAANANSYLIGTVLDVAITKSTVPILTSAAPA